MAGALKYVFVIVALVCYMQTAEMARLPRDTAELPGLPANFFENLAKPEYWSALTQNLTALSQDNLQKMGIKTEDVQNTLNNVASELQKNLAELTKNLQGLGDQQAVKKDRK